MSFSVWKYVLPVESRFDLEMPAGARPLSVDVQFGVPVLWALVDGTAPKVSRRFAVVATGAAAPAPDDGRFVGTFILHGGALVFHLFEALT